MSHSSDSTDAQPAAQPNRNFEAQPLFVDVNCEDKTSPDFLSDSAVIQFLLSDHDECRDAVSEA